VLVQTGAMIDEWRMVRPTGEREPYRFATEEQAARMLRTCYPDQVRKARLGASPTVRLAEIAAAPNYPDDV